MKGPSAFTIKVCDHCDDHEQVMVTSKPTYHHYCKNPEVQKKFIIKKAKEYKSGYNTQNGVVIFSSGPN